MSVFKLQHFSDTHAAAVQTRATVQLMKKTPADARIHTGDAVYNVYEDDFSYLSPYDFMFAVGNHDCVLRYGTEHYVASGVDWTQQPSQQEVYNKFIKPTLSSNPVTVKSGKTYWYRDYEESGIRIIGLNSCLRGSDYSEEYAWAEAVFAGCIKKKIKVFVAAHYPPFDVKATRCCFTDEMCMPSLTTSTKLAWMEFYPGVKELYELICTYADKGL